MVEPHTCAFLHAVSCVKNTLCLVVLQVLPPASPSLGNFPRQPQHPRLVWVCLKGYSGPYSSGDSMSQGKVFCFPGWNSTVFALSYVKWTPWALCLLFVATRYCLGLEWAWGSTAGCFWREVWEPSLMRHVVLEWLMDLGIREGFECQVFCWSSS